MSERYGSRFDSAVLYKRNARKYGYAVLFVKVVLVNISDDKTGIVAVVLYGVDGACSVLTNVRDFVNKGSSAVRV